jgi:3-hydroxyacyl-[acyl-carrier-protein] dehydratase
MLTTQDIMEILPHRYPFLLVDRVLEMEPGVRAVSEKMVTINEHFFQGHFPDYPVMPGVLIIEALAQTGAIAVLSVPEFQGKIAFFGGVDKVRFRRQVRPGDVLRMEVTIEKIKRGVGKGTGKATVDGELACEGGLLFAIGDRT